MFICFDCAPCVHLATSWGRCEKCGKVRECVDCKDPDHDVKTQTKDD